jgi:hypothetical protein
MVPRLFRGPSTNDMKKYDGPTKERKSVEKLQKRRLFMLFFRKTLSCGFLWEGWTSEFTFICTRAEKTIHRAEDLFYQENRNPLLMVFISVERLLERVMYPPPRLDHCLECLIRPRCRIQLSRSRDGVKSS